MAANLTNYSAICVTETKLLIYRHPLEKFIWNYIYPVQFTLGVLGNAMNLMVLLSKKMRASNANLFLAAMAVADIITLSVLMFGCLASYDNLARNLNYYTFFNEGKNQIIAMTNWFSAASIWFVLAVTVERLIAIRYPFQAKFWLTRKRILCSIFLIIILSLATTFHHHFTYEITRRELCAGTQIYYTVVAINHDKVRHRHSVALQNYVAVGTLVNVLFVIICPTFVLVALSICLVYSLVSQKQYFAVPTSPGGISGTTSCARNQERKVAITVVVIVIAFIIANIPSAAVYAWHLLANFEYIMPMPFYYVAWISNSLAVTGKVLNFFLFCLSSSHFREELAKTFGAKRTVLQSWVEMQRHRLESFTTGKNISKKDREKSHSDDTLMNSPKTRISLLMHIRSKAASLDIVETGRQHRSSS